MLYILFCSTILLDAPLNCPIDYLQTRGYLNIKSLKPFDLQEIINGVDAIIFEETNLNKVDKSFISVFAPYLKKSNEFNLLPTLNSGKNVDTAYLNLDLQFAGRIENNISLAQGIRFHFASKLDTTGPKPWKDIVQAYLNEGFCGIKTEKILLTLGRRNLLLGYGDHSLLLSPTEDGYDGYLFSYDGKYYEFFTNFAVLDPQQNRFISIHRIGLNLKSIKIGFSEAILWGDEFVPLYINFLLPYYLSQWGLYRNDNIMWCFDGLIRLSNLIIFGEFLIDDYQFSEPPPGYTAYPHKLAFQLGLKKILFEKIYFISNYTFVDKWVYSHELPKNIYQKDNLCLGFPLGNDVDKFSFRVLFFLNRRMLPKINFEFIRKGEGSIFLPYEVENGPAYPPFPSGIVEKTLKIISGIESYIGQRLYFSVDVGRKYIFNYAHQENLDKEENLFHIRFWFLF